MTTKVDELPADIFVLPVTLIVYNLVVKVGQIILLERLCTNTLFPLKSKREMRNTGLTVQSMEVLGFLKRNEIVKLLKTT